MGGKNNQSNQGDAGSNLGLYGGNQNQTQQNMGQKNNGAGGQYPQQQPSEYRQQENRQGIGYMGGQPLGNDNPANWIRGHYYSNRPPITAGTGTPFTTDTRNPFGGDAFPVDIPTAETGGSSITWNRPTPFTNAAVPTSGAPITVDTGGPLMMPQPQPSRPMYPNRPPRAPIRPTGDNGSAVPGRPMPIRYTPIDETRPQRPAPRPNPYMSVIPDSFLNDTPVFAGGSPAFDETQPTVGTGGPFITDKGAVGATKPWQPGPESPNRAAWDKAVAMKMYENAFAAGGYSEQDIMQNAINATNGTYNPVPYE